MSIGSRDANTDLPNLISFTVRLTDEAERLVSGITLRESGEPEDWDNLCFMAACFVSRQVDHLRGVLALVDKGLDSEALVLARNMLEGMIQLRCVMAQNGRRVREAGQVVLWVVPAPS